MLLLSLYFTVVLCYPLYFCLVLSSNSIHRHIAIHWHKCRKTFTKYILCDFRTELIFLCAVVLCCGMSADGAVDPCDDICTSACSLNGTCTDIPSILVCAEAESTCRSACATTCGCFQGCVISCENDKPRCIETALEKVANTYAEIACTVEEAICHTVCVPACPGKIFFDYLKSQVLPSDVTGVSKRDVWE